MRLVFLFKFVILKTGRIESTTIFIFSILKFLRSFFQKATASHSSHRGSEFLKKHGDAKKMAPPK
jgi:hypothetical protein